MGDPALDERAAADGQADARAERARVRPTPVGAVVLALTVAVALGRPPGVLGDLSLGALVGLVAVALALARRSGLERLEVRRRLPKVTTRGEAMPIVHEVTNAGGLLLRDLVVSERPPRPGTPAVDAGGRTLVPSLPPEASVEAVTSQPMGRRGVIELPGLTLRTSDPFGLFRVEQERDCPARVLVWPRARRTEARLLLARAAARQPVWSSAEEWTSVREWRAGDPLRLVHWRLSARRGFPVVRAFELGRQGRVLLVLDRRVPAGRLAEAAFERAVAVAAGLGQAALLERAAVMRFVAPGERDAIELDGLVGRAGLHRLLDALATVTPDARGAEGLGELRSNGATAVVVAPGKDAEVRG